MKAYTDYKFKYLYGHDRLVAPVREIEVLSYDGERFCSIKVGEHYDRINAEFIYMDAGRQGQVLPLTAPQLAELARQAMKFADLDDGAKERLVKKLHDQVGDYWHEPVYEDFSCICTTMGVEVGTTGAQPRANGAARDEIYFSGFGSQGDGACFAGNLRLADVAGAGARVREYAPQDTELHAIADQLELIVGVFMSTTVLLGVELDSPRIDISGQERGYRQEVASNILEYSTVDDQGDDGTLITLVDELEDAVEKTATDLANWLYKSLEAEYEYQTSAQSLIDRGVDYDEEGEEI